MLKIDLDVPDHTTLSRRGKTVQVHLPKQARGALHLAVDAERGEIQAAVLTEAEVHV